jgi:hypothetical protein
MAAMSTTATEAAVDAAELRGALRARAAATGAAIRGVYLLLRGVYQGLLEQAWKEWREQSKELAKKASDGERQLRIFETAMAVQGRVRLARRMCRYFDERVDRWCAQAWAQWRRWLWVRLTAVGFDQRRRTQQSRQQQVEMKRSASILHRRLKHRCRSSYQRAWLQWWAVVDEQARCGGVMQRSLNRLCLSQYAYAWAQWCEGVEAKQAEARLLRGCLMRLGQGKKGSAWRRWAEESVSWRQAAAAEAYEARIAELQQAHGQEMQMRGGGVLQRFFSKIASAMVHRSWRSWIRLMYVTKCADATAKAVDGVTNRLQKDSALLTQQWEEAMIAQDITHEEQLEQERRKCSAAELCAQEAEKAHGEATAAVDLLLVAEADAAAREQALEQQLGELDSCRAVLDRSCTRLQLRLLSTKCVALIGRSVSSSGIARVSWAWTRWVRVWKGGVKETRARQSVALLLLRRMHTHRLFARVERAMGTAELGRGNGAANRLTANLHAWRYGWRRWGQYVAQAREIELVLRDVEAKAEAAIAAEQYKYKLEMQRCAAGLRRLKKYEEGEGEAKAVALQWTQTMEEQQWAHAEEMERERHRQQEIMQDAVRRLETRKEEEARRHEQEQEDQQRRHEEAMQRHARERDGERRAHEEELQEERRRASASVADAESLGAQRVVIEVEAKEALLVSETQLRMDLMALQLDKDGMTATMRRRTSTQEAELRGKERELAELLTKVQHMQGRADAREREWQQQIRDQKSQVAGAWSDAVGAERRRGGQEQEQWQQRLVDAVEAERGRGTQEQQLLQKQMQRRSEDEKAEWQGRESQLRSEAEVARREAEMAQEALIKARSEASEEAREKEKRGAMQLAALQQHIDRLEADNHAQAQAQAQVQAALQTAAAKAEEQAKRAEETEAQEQARAQIAAAAAAAAVQRMEAEVEYAEAEAETQALRIESLEGRIGELEAEREEEADEIDDTKDELLQRRAELQMGKAQLLALGEELQAGRAELQKRSAELQKMTRRIETLEAQAQAQTQQQTSASFERVAPWTPVTPAPPTPNAVDTTPDSSMLEIELADRSRELSLSTELSLSQESYEHSQQQLYNREQRLAQAERQVQQYASRMGALQEELDQALKEARGAKEAKETGEERRQEEHGRRTSAEEQLRWARIELGQAKEGERREKERREREREKEEERERERAKRNADEERRRLRVEERSKFDEERRQHQQEMEEERRGKREGERAMEMERERARQVREEVDAQIREVARVAGERERVAALETAKQKQLWEEDTVRQLAAVEAKVQEGLQHQRTNDHTHSLVQKRKQQRQAAAMLLKDQQLSRRDAQVASLCAQLAHVAAAHASAVASASVSAAAGVAAASTRAAAHLATRAAAHLDSSTDAAQVHATPVLYLGGKMRVLLQRHLLERQLQRSARVAVSSLFARWLMRTCSSAPPTASSPHATGETPSVPSSTSPSVQRRVKALEYELDRMRSRAVGRAVRTMQRAIDRWAEAAQGLMWRRWRERALEGRAAGEAAESGRAAEEKARVEMEQRVRKEVEEEIRKEAAAEHARKEAEQIWKEANEKAKKEAEEKLREAAIEQARLEAIEQARLEAIEQARLEAIEQARLEAIEQARVEAIEQAR